MHSIRLRIISLTMAAILISVLALGTISYLAVRRETHRTSAETMRLICNERRNSINDFLRNVEHTQSIVAHFAVSEMSTAALAEGDVLGADGMGGEQLRQGDMDWQSILDDYLHSYSSRVEDVFNSAVSSSNGIMAYYFRINPELSKEEEGFLYTRISAISFIGAKMTDLSLYDPDDVEHVGWYYIPLERGVASWIGPYDNKNLGVKMISYVTPIFKADTFIGVVGVDINYTTLVDMVRDIHIYETDFAYLTEADGTIVYHPTLESGSPPPPENRELMQAVSRMQVEDQNEDPIHYTYDGVERQMFFATLSSGQKLVVTAPVKEINAAWTSMGRRLLLGAVALLTVFAAVSAVTVRRITEPLQRLTEASRSIAAGDYNVRLDEAGDDEVGTLTRAFQQLVEHLKIYISDLNSMAYRDALTGVKNKAAYEISAQKLNDLIRINGKGDPPEFAMIMLDCNDLKKINDTYGHEKGDVYLRAACKLICDVFPHSPVFRMGGDEFSVLLTDKPYAEREKLMSEFNRQAMKINASAKEPWECISIAKGIAAYDPAADANVESVLKRADELMYENKREIKAARANA